MHKHFAIVGAGLMGLAVGASWARAGTLATINIDGSFSDWAGVPVLLTDAADSTSIDIAGVQIANDASNLYLRFTYHAAVNPNAAGSGSLYLSFDTDNNTATGFNVYGIGTVGSEAAFSNDFPFDQRTGFNVGALSAAANIAPFAFGNPAATTTSQEYSIPRNLAFSPSGTPVFGGSFTLMAWTDSASVDVTTGIPYTFAVVPEPTTALAVSMLAMACARRRRSL